MKDDESLKRYCPYCGAGPLEYPYWQHLAQEHPEEFESDRQNWISLYNDYTQVAGMPAEVSLRVIAELYNVTSDDVKIFLEKEGKL